MESNLMTPRWKVTNNYPVMCWDFGDIITPKDGKSEYVIKSVSLREPLDKYPHLFRKLEWWEHRDESELPKYVKSISGHNKDKCYMVADKSQNGRAFHNDNEIEQQHLLRFGSTYIPIQESEYLTYINTKNQL